MNLVHRYCFVSFEKVFKLDYILIEMSTRKCENRASKRKRRKLQESVVKNSLSVAQ